MTLRVLISLMLLGAALTGCSGSLFASPTRIPITLVAPDALPTSVFTDPALRAGETDYNTICGHCHGYQGEGQLASTIENTMNIGMHTVPALNADGDTWQHPDQLLVRVIQEGVQNPLNQFQMPAFGAELSEERIANLLAYIRLWWTDDQRAHQRDVTEYWSANLQQLSTAVAPTATPAPTAESTPAS